MRKFFLFLLIAAPAAAQQSQSLPITLTPEEQGALVFEAGKMTSMGQALMAKQMEAQKEHQRKLADVQQNRNALMEAESDPAAKERKKAADDAAQGAK